MHICRYVHIRTIHCERQGNDSLVRCIVRYSCYSNATVAIVTVYELDLQHNVYLFVRNYHANRLLSAMCFAFYCFRFVQLFEINDQIGPKVFMLKKMSIDLFFFLFLLMVIIFKAH